MRGDVRAIAVSTLVATQWRLSSLAHVVLLTLGILKLRPRWRHHIRHSPEQEVRRRRTYLLLHTREHDSLGRELSVHFLLPAVVYVLLHDGASLGFLSLLYGLLQFLVLLFFAIFVDI